MTLPSLDEKHIAELKKLLATEYDLIENTIHVQFDAEGRMHVTAKQNGVVHQIEIKGETQ
jgi:DNA-directed RNA polymerase alpha subunit